VSYTVSSPLCVSTNSCRLLQRFKPKPVTTASCWAATDAGCNTFTTLPVATATALIVAPPAATNTELKEAANGETCTDRSTTSHNSSSNNNSNKQEPATFHRP
jgi:hypothetical protein